MWFTMWTWIVMNFTRFTICVRAIQKLNVCARNGSCFAARQHEATKCGRKRTRSKTSIGARLLSLSKDAAQEKYHDDYENNEKGIQRLAANTEAELSELRFKSKIEKRQRNNAQALKHWTECAPMSRQNCSNFGNYMEKLRITTRPRACTQYNKHIQLGNTSGRNRSKTYSKQCGKQQNIKAKNYLLAKKKQQKNVKKEHRARRKQQKQKQNLWKEQLAKKNKYFHQAIINWSCQKKHHV